MGWVVPVWRAVCTKRGPKKLPPIPTATTSFSAFPVAPTYERFAFTSQSRHLLLNYYLSSVLKDKNKLPRNHSGPSRRTPESYPELSRLQEPHYSHHYLWQNPLEHGEQHEELTYSLCCLSEGVTRKRKAKQLYHYNANIKRIMHIQNNYMMTKQEV